MASRLLKVLIPSEEEARAREILEGEGSFPTWSRPLSDPHRSELVLLVPAEGNDGILDALNQAFQHDPDFRLVLLPVQATLPRIPEEEEPEPVDELSATPGRETVEEEDEERVHLRVNREELYTTMSDTAEFSWFYMVMVALSTVVAAAGLLMGDTAVIIGAMVIAPLLGPNMALAFSNTLGDPELGRKAASSAVLGALGALAISWALGLVLNVDPGAAELAGRTNVGYGHLALALASGSAGALAMSRGTGTGLVGVMVAVALLPPLVAAGLLLGDGHTGKGISALMLVLANIAAVNLAAIATFVVQGVRPTTWWEKGQARSGSIRAAALWLILLAGLSAIIYLDL
ncbi:MAG: TIGR00341 family protein [Gemmatimonadota bacterium]